ncbi:MAG TPA: GrpB family protein [Acidimicrobiales bacterium]|nr:GrpB family protein [Acidimicrobiales bacterium]
MPFPDEVRPVEVVAYRPAWPAEFAALAAGLLASPLAARGAVDHIGSTAVPGLAAKDVIDVQVRLPHLDEDRIAVVLGRAGFRRRSEPWNCVEETRTGPVRKLVFAPPAGARAVNVHVRRDGTCGARDALLFRDYLRHDPRERDAWGALKRALAAGDGALAAYGRAKQPGWRGLMARADTWAAATGWRARPLGPWGKMGA